MSRIRERAKGSGGDGEVKIDVLSDVGKWKRGRESNSKKSDTYVN